MSAEYQFTLPLPPRNNVYYRNHQGRTRLSKEAHAYKKAVAALLAGTKPIEGPVCLSARVYRARNAGDLDGFQKGCLDACEGFLYFDDKQIVAMHWYQDLDRKNPRLELRVWEASE